VLDHDQDLEAEEDGVDMGEVDGEDRAGLRRQELAPGWAGPQGSGIDASALRESPHGRGSDLVAESEIGCGVGGRPAWRLG
jgi:hypothetical protein